MVSRVDTRSGHGLMDPIGSAQQFLEGRPEQEIHGIYDKVRNALEHLDCEIPLFDVDILDVTEIDQRGSSEADIWSRHCSTSRSYAEQLVLAALPPRTVALEELIKPHSLETAYAATVRAEASGIAKVVRSAEARKAANVRYIANHQVREYALALYHKRGPWKSMRQAAKKLKQEVVDFARQIDANVLKGEDPWETIYKWFLKAFKK